MPIESWLPLLTGLGGVLIGSLFSLWLTNLQLKNADKRFERELAKAREDAQRRRCWEVRGEPLLKLREELARMATKQVRYLSALRTQHTHFHITEEQAQQELQIAMDDWNAYLLSGEFSQAKLTQFDSELAQKAGEILQDFHNSGITQMQVLVASKTGTGRPPKDDLLESLHAEERNEKKIIEIQELINKRLEEL